MAVDFAFANFLEHWKASTRPARVSMAAILLLATITTVECVYSARVLASEASAISAQELHELFPGQFKVIVRGVLRLYISAQRDGSLLAKQIGKTDTGTWEIRADQLCIKFSKWLKGRTRCSRVVATSGWYKTGDVAFKRLDGVMLANP